MAPVVAFSRKLTAPAWGQHCLSSAWLLVSNNMGLKDPFGFACLLTGASAIAKEPAAVATDYS